MVYFINFITWNNDSSQYVSLLRPPLSDSSAPGAEVIDKVEWKQVFDILWSDPQENKGCVPNSLRGAGTYFGPDVTKNFLEKYNLQYIIRSHECKPDGYEVCHNNSVITIFSASNYYEVGSNNGAYLKLVGTELDTHYVQYMAVTGRRKLNLYQRMGLVESSATKELQMQILSNRQKIEELFAAADPENTGYMSISEWAKSLEEGTGLQIPWRMLKEKLVVIDLDTNKVKYQTTFDVKSDKLNSVQGATTVVETLYRNKCSLEAIFRIIDKDNSGYITLDEFSEACNLIKEHMPSPITQEQLEEICKLMDLNKDGLVDLNEFLESFRMVDPESKIRKGSQPTSPEARQETLKLHTLSVAANNQCDPLLSPAVVKPLNLLPKTHDISANTHETFDSSSKKNTNNITNANNLDEIEENEKVEVHIQPNNEDSVKEIPVIHTNSLQMSPVLSSRRGSQI